MHTILILNEWAELFLEQSTSMTGNKNEIIKKQCYKIIARILYNFESFISL